LSPLVTAPARNAGRGARVREARARMTSPSGTVPPSDRELLDNTPDTVVGIAGRDGLVVRPSAVQPMDPALRRGWTCGNHLHAAVIIANCIVYG